MKRHIPDLDLCKKLKEVGYKQEGFYWWRDFPNIPEITDKKLSIPNEIEYIAPLASELIERLPKFIAGNELFTPLIISITDLHTRSPKGFRVFYYGGLIKEKYPPETIIDEKLCNALAKMYIYLAEKHPHVLTTPERT